MFKIVNTMILQQHCEVPIGVLVVSLYDTDCSYAAFIL